MKKPEYTAPSLFYENCSRSSSCSSQNGDSLLLRIMQRIIEQSVPTMLPVDASLAIIDTTKTFFYSCGTRSPQCDDPLKKTDVYEIGSITKLFTISALLMLVEQGLVRLDDPIELYLPCTVRIPQKNGVRITLRHLAQHTSGLPRLPVPFCSPDPSNPYRGYNVKQLYTFLDTYHLTEKPGANLTYSNVGIGLLGHILTRVARCSYDQLIQKLICKPLGMHNTRVILSDAMKRNLVPGYATAHVPAPYWEGGALEGAGFLHSTSEDMSIFLSAALGIVEFPLTGILRRSYEELSYSTHSTSTMSTVQIGFGWIIAHPTPYRTVVWHNGETGGFHSFIGFDTTLKRGVVILTNCATSRPERLGFQLLSPLIRGFS